MPRRGLFAGHVSVRSPLPQDASRIRNRAGADARTRQPTRRRATAPISARPAPSMAQVVGSGTGAV